jgi:hypothetical protein
VSGVAARWSGTGASRSGDRLGDLLPCCCGEAALRSLRCDELGDLGELEHPKSAQVTARLGEDVRAGLPVGGPEPL